MSRIIDIISDELMTSRMLMSVSCQNRDFFLPISIFLFFSYFLIISGLSSYCVKFAAKTEEKNVSKQSHNFSCVESTEFFDFFRFY